MLRLESLRLLLLRETANALPGERQLRIGLFEVLQHVLVV